MGLNPSHPVTTPLGLNTIHASLPGVAPFRRNPGLWDVIPLGYFGLQRHQNILHGIQPSDDTSILHLSSHHSHPISNGVMSRGHGTPHHILSLNGVVHFVAIHTVAFPTAKPQPQRGSAPKPRVGPRNEGLPWVNNAHPPNPNGVVSTAALHP